MKKIIALMLAIFMMAAIAVPAFAEDGEGESSDVNVFEGGLSNSLDAGGTTITYGAKQAYEVTVPADFNLEANKTTAANLKVAKYMLDVSKTLTITVSSENATDDEWFLVEVVEEGAEKTAADVPYTISVDGNPVVKGGTILTLKTGAGQNGEEGADIVSVLSFFTAGTSQVATFQDYITFHVAIA